MNRPALGPGDRFERYVLHEKIGQGGMGVVYRAEDTRLGRMVALKFLPPGSFGADDELDRFSIEARAAANINHPNVCTVYEISDSDGLPYIAMEYVEGRTLKQVLSDGPLDMDSALSLALQVGRGLSAAHQAGVLHRDIKAANVLVTEDGTAKIVDFGLAKTSENDLTASNQILGTIDYMSPEVLDGARSVDARSDIWSFGVMLYEMITGRRPFSGAQVPAVMYQILSVSPESVSETRPDVPPAVERIVDRCLRKDPQDRFQSMDQVLSELRGDAVELPSPWLRERKWGRLPWTAVAGLALLLIGLAAISSSGLRDVVASAFAEPSLPDNIYLAVLPFAAEDAADSALAVAVSNQVSTRLASLAGTQPSFWTVSASDLEGAEPTPQQAGVRGATLAAVGRLSSSGDHAELVIELIEPGTGRVLRSGRARAVRSDLVAIRDSASALLTGLLGVPLTPASRRLLAAGSRDGPATFGAPEIYLRGMRYLERRDDPEQLALAIQQFDAAIRADGDFAPAYAGLAQAQLYRYRQAKDTTDARAAIRNSNVALEKDDGLAAPHVTMGLVQVETGAYGSAIGSFRSALAIEPGSADAMLGLARAYEEVGRHEDAQQQLEVAISLRPGHWEGYQELGVFFNRQRNREAAAEQFRTVTVLAPANVAGWRNFGAVQFYLGDLDGAIQTFEQANNLSPSYAVYMNLGTAYYSLEDYAASANAYGNALELNDDDFRTWAFRGAALNWDGRPAEAKAAWERMLSSADERLSVNSRDEVAAAYRAMGHVRLGNIDEANRYLRELEAASPSQRPALYATVLAYEALGRRDDALTALDQALTAGARLSAVADDPWLVELRADTAYAELAARHGAADEAN